MYVLIGEGYSVDQVEIGGAFEENWFEERVALFSDEYKARRYAESFRLARAQHDSFSAPQVFRRLSPMSRFVSYRIEEEVEEVLEVNPKGFQA